MEFCDVCLRPYGEVLTGAWIQDMGAEHYARSNNCNHVTDQLLASAGTKYALARKEAAKQTKPAEGYNSFKKFYTVLEVYYAFFGI